MISSVRGTGVCPPLAGVGGGLSGGLSASGLWVNEQGQLVAETALGPVTFTKPIAYQEIDGKRVNVEVEYIIENAEYRKQKSEDINQNAVVKIQQCIEEWHMPHLIQNAGYWIHDYHESCLVDCESCIMSFASDSNSQTHNSPTQDTITPQPSNSGTPQLTYGFRVASYDKTKELIIDPLLASTYLGGSSYDYAYGIALDSSGNVYVAGDTESSDFPMAIGIYDTSYNGSSDVFVSKLDSELTNLLTFTYLGGSNIDHGYAIDLDSRNNVYVTGVTQSSNFPTTKGAYETTRVGYEDVFISKLDDSLSNLLASTYLGGSSGDRGYAIVLDINNNVYVTGSTSSNTNDFPTTIGAYDTKSGGIFISKLDGSLSNLLASTFLGGNLGYAIAIDSSSNVYITGYTYTYSSDFPTTIGAYDTSGGGSYDAFVSKLDSTLSSLQASTYLGGSSGDTGRGIALDSNNNVYVTGATKSSNFPTTKGAYNTSGGASSYNYDVFVSKLDNSLSSLHASTYLVGSNDDRGYAITIDSNDNVYIAGFTKSSDFPVTSNAYDTSGEDSSYNYDVFVSKLDSSLSNLHASTYLGGTDEDRGYAITINSNNNVYITGYTLSSDFPTTDGAYDTSFSGGYDVFISKLDSNCPDASEIIATTASVDTDTLILAKGSSEEVTIIVTDNDGCTAEGVKVTRKLSSANKKMINVKPLSAKTDASGQATFTISAKMDKGEANVKFRVSGVKDKPAVTIVLAK